MTRAQKYYANHREEEKVRSRQNYLKSKREKAQILFDLNNIKVAKNISNLGLQIEKLQRLFGMKG